MDHDDDDDEIRMWAKDMQAMDPLSAPLNVEAIDALFTARGDRFSEARLRIETAIRLLEEESGPRTKIARALLEVAAKLVRKASVHKDRNR